MSEEEILKVIYEKCTNKDGKRYLSCTMAHIIAKELDANIKIIGKVCNDNKIKIKHCELGCF